MAEPGPHHRVFVRGKYWVLLELAEIDGISHPVRVDIRTYADVEDGHAYPITPSFFDAFPLTELVDQMKPASHGALDPPRRRIDEAPPGSHPPRMSPERKARILRDLQPELEAYERACDLGSRSPTRDVAELYGLKYWTAVDRIRRLREAGWLPSGGRGKAAVTPRDG